MTEPKWPNDPVHVPAHVGKGAMSRGTVNRVAGHVQRLDTHHGLAWDGPGPVPRVYGLKAAKPRPTRGIFRKGCILPTTMRDQAPGPMPRETMHALLQPTPPILLRHRSARHHQVPVPP